MILDFLSQQSHQKFKENGIEILQISYKGHFYFGDLRYRIYRMNGEYAIFSEQHEAYGPVQSLTEALQWEGFKYTIEDFEISSEVLTRDSLKSLEHAFLNRMNDMAFRNPSLIPKLDAIELWEAIDLHLKNTSAINCPDLKAYLIPRSVYGEVFLDKIILLTVEKEYSKILFKFGIDTIQLLMEYFLKQEDYHICREINDMVIKHNEQTDNDLSATI
jgi:hypothetical protein